MDELLSEMEEITSLCLEGLTTDGAHHKQAILENILRLATSPQEIQELFRLYGWEEGVQP